MDNMDSDSIDVVLTSPPYNNSRTCHSEYSMRTDNCRYDSYNDNMPNDEYIKWTLNLFNHFDKILKPNGVVLYNISYGSENPNVMWETISAIIHDTVFMVAENIIWKKPSAYPNNVSPNKLTRVVEPVFVFCRKDEYETYYTNKKVASVSKVGQKVYENSLNDVEARNNDEQCDLNNATYSSELCEKLLKIYSPDRGTVFDPFMGTGTTAVACQRMGLSCIGTEISAKQVEYALNRVKGVKVTNNVTMKVEELW